MLDAEPLVAGATPCRLDFVGNKVAAILLHDVERHLEIFLGRGHETGDALDGLGEKCGNLPGGGGLNHLLQISHAGNIAIRILKSKRAAIAVRVHGMYDPYLDRPAPPSIDSREAPG